MFRLYLWFALLVNPILVAIGMTLSYHVLGMDTSNAAWNPTPFIPFLLVRLFWVPIFLIPFVGIFIYLRNLKKLTRTNK